MTLFSYTSIAPGGARKTGKLEASDEMAARQTVSAYGDVLVELTQVSKRSWFKFESHKELSLQAASSFAIELSSLIAAGAPLRQALDIQSQGTGAYSRLAGAALRDVENGLSLSSVLRHYGKAANLLAEFAAAGEAGAGLDRLMATGGAFLEARAEALSKIRSAMAYPIFIMLLALIAIVVITLYVAPALAPTMEESGSGGFILVLAQTGTWLKARSMYVLLGLAVLIGFIFWASKSHSWKRRINQALWSLPLIGSIQRDLDTGQSCEVMATLLENGRTLEQSLIFASNVSGPVLSAAYISVIERLRDGQVASAAFAAETRIPQDVRRLALLGERSSAFAVAMRQAGIISQTRAMRRIEQLAAMAGPLLVIGMGGVIAGMMLTVLGSLSGIGEGAL